MIEEEGGVMTGCRSVLHCHLRCVLQGCSMFTSVKAFEGQQYSTLKRQCLQSGLLFEDPRFPATDDSLFYQGNRIGRVVWKRPRVGRLVSAKQKLINLIKSAALKVYCC